MLLMLSETLHCYARLQYAKHLSKRKNECQCICVKPQERVLAMNVNARQNRANLWVKSFSRITEMGKNATGVDGERMGLLLKFTFSLPLSYYHRWKSQFKKSDRCVVCVCVLRVEEDKAPLWDLFHHGMVNDTRNTWLNLISSVCLLCASVLDWSPSLSHISAVWSLAGILSQLEDYGLLSVTICSVLPTH